MPVDQCDPCSSQCIFHAYNSEPSFRQAVLQILCQLNTGVGEISGVGGGTAYSVGAGAVDASTQRIVSATDDPGVVSLSVIDDWDESDRAKVNLITGQAGITGGAGSVGASTPRVTLASDDPAVSALGTVNANLGTVNTSIGTGNTSLSTLAGAISGGRAKISASSSWSYTALSDATITLASLATSSNVVAGRQSASISTAGYEDIICAGKVTVGTTPTANTRIEVWCVGSIDGTNWPDSVGETDAAKTWTTAGIKYLSARLVASMDVLATTSDVTFPIPLTSIRNIFEGILPTEIVFWVGHNTAVNLNSTAGNHAINVSGLRKVLGA